jgi:YesN/AraC family two-component response regulator
LEAFKANPDAFDLLITDMAMPNMTGDLLAKAVKSIKPHLPVIICTGFSERINRERAQAIGVNGFLMKPVIRSQLAGMVRNVLDENARASAAPVSP